MGKHYIGTWESVRQHKVPQWYEDCKFGIFIHWGIYSVPAYAPRTWELGEIPGNEEWFCNNPYAEWYYNSVNVGRGPTYERHINLYGKDFKYEDFIPLWKAESWNPEEWAKLFKKAGAKYVVLTTKHHDGFCLFPSKYTDFDSTHLGPMRNITGELTDAVRKGNMRMGLYYSGLIDWQFAHDPIFCDDDMYGTASPTFAYADYSYKQMVELIDTYHPSVLWNDIGWPKQSENAMPYLLAHYYNTVQEGVVNDRFNGLYKDFSTKEYQAGNTSRKDKWEMCRGMGLSFGYNENEGDDQLISLPDLIRLLVSTVANNGNLLINIGPKADGTIPAEQEKRLLALGEWLQINGEGIYDTRCSTRENREKDDKNAGKELWYTKKGADLYIYSGELTEGENHVEIPDLSIPVTSLDNRLIIENIPTEKGMRLIIKNYKHDMHIVGFKAAGAEKE